MKKAKILPIVLTSRESLESTVAQHVQLSIELVEKKAAMEREIAQVQEKHQKGILETTQQIAIKEASIYTYCQAHRSTLFPEKKSIDLLLATVGFRTNPPSVEKVGKKVTWDDIAKRLQATDWGADYITDPTPEVSKVKLLADREKLDKEKLQQVGIIIDQEEEFFIKPKSEVAEESKKEAA
jgi:phage host-nuclease inhibitor protein Gam